jgi:phosphatidylinositol 3-kinase
VCIFCDEHLKEIKPQKKYILIFSLLPLPLKDLYRLRLVSSSFKTAINTIVSILKAFKYKCGYEKWSGVERRLVLSHWREFKGHSRMMVLGMNAMSGVYDIPTVVRYYKCNKSEPISCKLLFCDHCSDDLKEIDTFEILCGFYSNQLLKYSEVESWVGQCFNNVSDEWISYTIPLFLQMGIKQTSIQRIFVNNIIPKIIGNKKLCFLFYFECNFFNKYDHLKPYFESLLDTFFQIVDKKTQTELISTVRFFSLLEAHDLHNISDIINSCRGQIVLPFDPDNYILGVDVNGITQYNSFTKPIKVPIQTSKGTVDLLLKNDDLRKDRFTISIVNIINSFISDKLSFITYNVLPVTTTFGVIEMVPHTETLYNINKTTSLQNYIIEHNINENMKTIRDRFIVSCASNCVIGYLIGIGDRNLKNILINKNGTMVHIDYSYIMGTDPKSVHLTNMRITKGMVDMLGGTNSQSYDKFKKTCSDMFIELKPYIYFWYTSFQYLTIATPPIEPHHNDFKALKEHIQNRLMPNVSNEEIDIIMVDVVNSSNDSMLAFLSDTSHNIQTKVSDIIFNLIL